jgi:septal ring factor EnvC (AmiA/AmiB activator)
MKPKFSIMVASFVLGLSVCSTSFASGIDDPTVQKDAAAELAALSQQISANPKIQDKDKNKALEAAVEKYVKDKKKAFEKEKDNEEKLEKDQRKLEAQAKEKEREAEEKSGAITSAKTTENKADRDVDVANTVEEQYKHPVVGVTLTSDSQ